MREPNQLLCHYQHVGNEAISRGTPRALVDRTEETVRQRKKVEEIQVPREPNIP